MGLIGLSLLGVLLLVARAACSTTLAAVALRARRCSARRSPTSSAGSRPRSGASPGSSTGCCAPRRPSRPRVSAGQIARLADPVRPGLPAAVRGLHLPAGPARSSTDPSETDATPEEGSEHELQPRSEHDLVRARGRAADRLRHARRLRPRRGRPAPVRQEGRATGASCSTPSARSGTATRSGWSPAAARSSPPSPRSTPRSSPASTWPSCCCSFALIFRAVSIEFRSKQPVRWLAPQLGRRLLRRQHRRQPAHRRGPGQHRLGHPPATRTTSTPAASSTCCTPTPCSWASPPWRSSPCTAASTSCSRPRASCRTQVRGWVNRTIVFFIICYVLTTMATLLFVPHMTEPFKRAPAAARSCPCSTLLAIANIPREMHHGRDFRAFLSSCAAMAALDAPVRRWACIPTWSISSPDPSNSLTIYNAASSPKTLKIMLIIAGSGCPSCSPTPPASTGSSAAR